MQLLMYYFTGINVITFLAFGWDKYCAKRGMWRMPEKTLLGLVMIGGTIGAYLAMEFYRHKTRKGNFRSAFWVIVMLQVILVVIRLMGFLPMGEF